MARAQLPDAVQGGLRPSPLITWLMKGTTTPLNLTLATAITGTIRNLRTGEVREIVGALTVTDAEAGQFRWDYDAEDVADGGNFRVIFSAAFSGGPTPGKTFAADWYVEPIDVVVP
jgi:hypothetical protein